MTESDRRCPHCGSSVQEHRHRLNRPLVEALERVAREAEYLPKPVHISKLGLNHGQLANFQKLQYWGLVEAYVTPENKRRRGWWAVTIHGLNFLFGRTSVPRNVWTLHSKRQRFEGTSESVGSIIEGFELRGDYADAARPILERFAAGSQGMLFASI